MDRVGGRLKLERTFDVAVRVLLAVKKSISKRMHIILVGSVFLLDGGVSKKLLHVKWGVCGGSIW